MKTREEQREMRLNSCVHFNGTQNPKCEKGVSYLDIRDANVRPYGYPCFPPGENIPCADREYPTEEMLDQEDAEIQRVTDEINTISEMIRNESQGMKYYSGSKLCPICKKGQLNYSVNPLGRIMAECTTVGCLVLIA